MLLHCPDACSALLRRKHLNECKVKFVSSSEGFQREKKEWRQSHSFFGVVATATTSQEINANLILMHPLAAGIITSLHLVAVRS